MPDIEELTLLLENDAAVFVPPLLLGLF